MEVLCNADVIAEEISSFAKDIDKSIVQKLQGFDWKERATQRAISVLSGFATTEEDKTAIVRFVSTIYSVLMQKGFQLRAWIYQEQANGTIAEDINAGDIRQWVYEGYTKGAKYVDSDTPQEMRSGRQGKGGELTKDSGKEIDGRDVDEKGQLKDFEQIVAKLASIIKQNKPGAAGLTQAIKEYIYYSGWSGGSNVNLDAMLALVYSAWLDLIDDYWKELAEQEIDAAFNKT